MGITITLLSYKEEENLKILIPQIINNIEKVESDYEILVVDTEKPLDNTVTVCEEFGVRYVNQKYPGFGGAFKTAIEYAQKNYFLIMDSDGSHNPTYISNIYNKFLSEDADVVIGSRYIKGAKTCDSASSIVMSKILNTTFRVCLGIKAHDISTDYRMYYSEQLKQITLENRNYDVLQEVLLKFLSEVSDSEQIIRAALSKTRTALNVILHDCTNSRKIRRYVWGLNLLFLPKNHTVRNKTLSKIRFYFANDGFRHGK